MFPATAAGPYLQEFCPPINLFCKNLSAWPFSPGKSGPCWMAKPPRLSSYNKLVTISVAPALLPVRKHHSEGRGCLCTQVSCFLFRLSPVIGQGFRMNQHFKQLRRGLFEANLQSGRDVMYAGKRKTIRHGAMARHVD